MKIPFSYKNPGLLRPFLISSLLGHVLFLGGGNLIFSGPRFSVEQAPSSMEIILLKEEPEFREKKPKAEEILTSDSAAEKTPLVKKKKTAESDKSKKPLASPLEKGSLVEMENVYLKNPVPVYPSLARERGWQGLVTLEAAVDGEGRPASVEIFRSSGHSILDEAALKTVRKWRFLPARAGQIFFPSRIKIPIRFLLVEEG